MGDWVMGGKKVENTQVVSLGLALVSGMVRLEKVGLVFGMGADQKRPWVRCWVQP